MNYASLQTAVKAWLNKPEADQQITTAIEMVEADLNRRLRVRKMIARATATLDAEYSTVPTDFLGPRTFLIDGETTALRFIDPDGVNQTRWQYDTTGKPVAYTIEGGEFRYIPAPGEEYTAALTYWQKVPALSDSNTSNWVLAGHPDAYLYGALVHALGFVGPDERLPLWSSRYEDALAGISRSDHTESYGALEMRAANIV